jgi:hypothetical protein
MVLNIYVLPALPHTINLQEINSCAVPLCTHHTLLRYNDWCCYNQNPLADCHATRLQGAVLDVWPSFTLKAPKNIHSNLHIV